MCVCVCVTYRAPREDLVFLGGDGWKPPRIIPGPWPYGQDASRSHAVSKYVHTHNTQHMS